MTWRRLRLPALVSAGVIVASVQALSQLDNTASTSQTAWAVPRTPWGHPDLQGTWTNTTITPLERPPEASTRQFLTEDEVVAVTKVAQNRGDRPPRPGDPGSYNTFWLERGTDVVHTRRTSLIIDPPNGRLPPLTLEGEKRKDANAVRGTDSPENRSLYERCITRGLPAAMIPGFYNHNYQIVQTPTYVLVVLEMIHEARVIPLDGRPHLPPSISQWLGDPSGHWEGDALVVETTNFSAKSAQFTGGTGDASTSYTGVPAGFRIVERFERIEPDLVDYRFTVDAPSTFVSPWTAAIPMTRLAEQIYEYACHEGNYSMWGMLKGARAAEKGGADNDRR